MIEKFQQKIFYVLFIPIAVIITGIIVGLTIYNRNNLIKSSTFMLDRFANGFSDKLDFANIESTIFEDVYRVKVVDGEIVLDYDIIDQEIIKKVQKIIYTNQETGLIGNYIFKVQKSPNVINTVNVILMKNETITSQINKLYIIMICSIFLTIVFTYTISKKVTVILVKPIKETMEKQKQFISDVSHELKTPLSVIKANTDVLETENSENKWINYIQNEIESMNKLISELLLLAKTENVNAVKQYGNINLSQEAEIVTSRFESVAYEKGVVIENAIGENISFHCNKEDIEHIFSTLIDNAIKHALDKSTVLVEVKKEKNDILINIKNAGDEIPVEEREKIFERFYRVDKSRNRNSKRYGLGLAIAKASVEKYNGTIEVHCDGGYTTFKVKLPIK